MAEQDKHSKTEDATPRKREKARGEGKVAKSTDLIFGLVLIAAAGLILLVGPKVRDGFLELLEGSLGELTTADGSQLTALGVNAMIQSVFAALPLLLGIVPVILVGSFGQIGVNAHPEKLKPKPEKALPQLTITKFVNAKSLVETLTSILKLVLLVGAAYLSVFADAPRVLQAGTLQDVGGEAAALSVRLLLSVGIMLVFIGLIDLALKRKNLDEELRTTKDEVKQEMKDAMGDPEVKGHIKRQQRELAMRRMMDDVPSASVVITNPTHFAVALRYQNGAAAPTVVAKGKNYIAQRIREIAQAARVPLVENPPLARSLYATVNVGDEIPPELYQAVAEVLATILKTRLKPGSRLGRTA